MSVIHSFPCIAEWCECATVYLTVDSLKDICIVSSLGLLQITLVFVITVHHGSLIAQLVKNLPAMLETPVQFLGMEDPLEKRYPLSAIRSSILGLPVPCGLAGKESACNAGCLGWEDPLEKGMATDSSILAWRIPWTV